MAQYGTQESAIINKFCDFTILHDKDTKYVRIYMKNIINCCSGESYVSCDHVMVRGLKRYAVQVVEVLLLKKVTCTYMKLHMYLLYLFK
jgi:hypothetical protein